MYGVLQFAEHFYSLASHKGGMTRKAEGSAGTAPGNVQARGSFSLWAVWKWVLRQVAGIQGPTKSL